MKRRQFLSAATLSLALAAGPLAVATGAHADDSARAAGWSNSFNGSKAGWSSVSGSWALNSGSYWANGQPGYWTSTKHTGTWRNFVYQARVKRDGNGGGYWANSLMIHGNPLRLNNERDWCPSYHFNFTNTGYFSVFFTDTSGNTYAIKDWTYAGVIRTQLWKTVKVVSQNGYFSFSINGRTVWSGYDYSRSSGQVGYAFYTATNYWSTMRLDSASLQTLASNAKVTLDPPAQLGATVAGGSLTRSPR